MISGAQIDVAKDAVTKCRKAGIKAILLTSSEGVEARSQANQLGIFTKRSKTIEDIAARLQVSVAEVFPRTASSKIVTKDEIWKEGDANSENSGERMRNILKKYNELIFTGLNEAEKEVLAAVDNKCKSMHLFVMC